MRLAGKLVPAILTVAFAILWFGCAEKITNDQSGQYNVAIKASWGDFAAASPQSDDYRYRLRVTARDMDEIDTLLSLEDGLVVGNIEVPSGTARRFVLTAEEWVITTPVTHVGPDDTTITVIFQGERTVDVLPGQAVRLSISMRPMIPMVKLSPKYSTVDGGDIIDCEVMVYNVPDLFYISLDFQLPWEMVDPFDVVRGADLGDNVEFYGGFGEGVYCYASDTSNGNAHTPIVDSHGDVHLCTLRMKTQAAAGEALSGEMYTYGVYAQAQAEGGPVEDVDSLIAVDTAYLSLLTVPDMVVTFPDAELDAAVRNSIGVSGPDDLMLSVLLSDFTYLEASESGIVDLTNLNLCTNLRSAYLGYNNITNISPLSALTNLRYLELNYDEVGSVVALAPLRLLRSLSLNNCGISDIAPLQGMTYLQSLQLANNNIVSIAALSGLTGLYSLDLSGNDITDISPLVQNSDFADGDQVILTGNPLSTESVNVYIPELRGRGVTVMYVIVGVAAQ